MQMRQNLQRNDGGLALNKIELVHAIRQNGQTIQLSDLEVTRGH